MQWENARPLLTSQGFVLPSPHTAELPWQGSYNLVLVFRLLLWKQFICIHSLTLDDTWYLKSIIFENVLSVACNIGETRRAMFPKIAWQKSLLSSSCFNSALVLVSCGGGCTSGLSRVKQKRRAPTGFQVLCCSASSCGQDPMPLAPCTTPRLRTLGLHRGF